MPSGYCRSGWMLCWSHERRFWEMSGTDIQNGRHGAPAFGGPAGSPRQQPEPNRGSRTAMHMEPTRQPRKPPEPSRAISRRGWRGVTHLEKKGHMATQRNALRFTSKEEQRCQIVVGGTTVHSPTGPSFSRRPDAGPFVRKGLRGSAANAAMAEFAFKCFSPTWHSLHSSSAEAHT